MFGRVVRELFQGSRCSVDLHLQSRRGYAVSCCVPSTLRAGGWERSVGGTHATPAQDD